MYGGLSMLILPVFRLNVVNNVSYSKPDKLNAKNMLFDRSVEDFEFKISP